MAIQVEWYGEHKTIIVQRYPETWTWDDFDALQEIVPPMMNEVSHTVHVVGDYSEHQYMPEGNALIHARKLMNSYPDNFGMLIIVTRPGVIQIFVKVFIKIFGHHFNNNIRIVHSWDDVQKAIQQYKMCK